MKLSLKGLNFLATKIDVSENENDDDDNEIDNIAKGNMDVANIDEGEEEPPSETAPLDVSEDIVF